MAGSNDSPLLQPRPEPPDGVVIGRRSSPGSASVRGCTWPGSQALQQPLVCVDGSMAGAATTHSGTPGSARCNASRSRQSCRLAYRVGLLPRIERHGYQPLPRKGLKKAPDTAVPVKNRSFFHRNRSRFRSLPRSEQIHWRHLAFPQEHAIFLMGLARSGDGSAGLMVSPEDLASSAPAGEAFCLCFVAVGRAPQAERSVPPLKATNCSPYNRLRFINMRGGRDYRQSRESWQNRQQAGPAKTFLADPSIMRRPL